MINHKPFFKTCTLYMDFQVGSYLCTLRTSASMFKPHTLVYIAFPENFNKFKIVQSSIKCLQGKCSFKKIVLFSFLRKGRHATPFFRPTTKNITKSTSQHCAHHYFFRPHLFSDGVFLDLRPSVLLPIRPTSTWFYSC